MNIRQNVSHSQAVLENKIESAIEETPISVGQSESAEEIEPNIEIAKRFLSMLSTGNDDSKFWFNTWDDRKDSNDPDLNGIYEFSLKDELTYLSNLNKRGAAVSVQISKSNGRQFSYSGARAIWVDIDAPRNEHPFTTEPRPHIVVESSKNKFHGYWLLEDTPEQDLSLALKALASCWKDADVKAARVHQPMRVPGFYHQKDEPFLTNIHKFYPAPRYTVDDIIKGYGVNTWNFV